MMNKEARAAKGAEWLGHLREWAASGERFADYARGHGLDAEAGYRWKRILRRAGMWSGPSESGSSKSSAVSAKRATARFARVRIAAEPRAASTALRLQLQLSNGRRAELVLGAEELPRILGLLEQPA